MTKNIENIRQDMILALTGAADELARATSALVNMRLTPEPPTWKWKPVWLAPGVELKFDPDSDTWTAHITRADGFNSFMRVCTIRSDHWISHADAIERLVDIAKGRPRKVLRMVRRIQALTEWAVRLAETKRQESARIAEAQESSLRALREEATFIVLGKQPQ